MPRPFWISDPAWYTSVCTSCTAACQRIAASVARSKSGSNTSGLTRLRPISRVTWAVIACCSMRINSCGASSPNSIRNGVPGLETSERIVFAWNVAAGW